MKRIRNLVAALAIAGSALVVATPDATPVQAATYTCGIYKNTSSHPDWASGSCNYYGAIIRYYRIVITCSTNGSPVNQVTRYGPWVRPDNNSSKAFCSSTSPYLIGAYMQQES